MDAKSKAARPIPWAEIRQAYEREKAPVKTICQKFNIKAHQLYKVARENGWQMRAAAPQKPEKIKQTYTKAAKSSGPVRHQRPKQAPCPYQSLREALEFITMDLMHRIKRPRASGEEGFEKEARTLSSLVRTYEKLKTIEAESPVSHKRKEQSDQLTEDETTNQRRRDLAARLEKLIKTL